MKVDNNRQNRVNFIIKISIVSSLIVIALLLLNHVQVVFDLVSKQTAQIQEVQSQIENINIG